MSSLPGLLLIAVGLYMIHLGINGSDWLPISDVPQFVQVEAGNSDRNSQQ